MRMRSTILTLMLALAGAPVRADHHASIELHLVVPSGGTVFPSREGRSLRLGPALGTPLEPAHVERQAREVRLTLAPTSAKSLRAITAAHRGQRIALVVDGTIEVTPLVRDAITGGQLSITFRSPAAAAALARALLK